MTAPAAASRQLVSDPRLSVESLAEVRILVDALLAQLSQLERLTGIFWGFADENGRVFKGWLLEIACSEDQAPFQGRGLA
jgi:hypothetical protein